MRFNRDVKAALFDLDDTLFDHGLANLRGLESVREEYPLLSHEPLESLKREYSELLEELHVEVLAGRLSLEQAREERFRRMFAARGEKHPDKKARRAASLHRRTYLASRRPVAGVIELLRALHSRNVTVGVVTNNPTREQESKLGACRLDGLVDFLVTSEDVGEPKPGRVIFEFALKHAGCQSTEAVMVGDSWRIDVLGAAASGIHAVWFNRYHLPCPNRSLAAEIHDFEPVDTVLSVILQEKPSVVC